MNYGRENLRDTAPRADYNRVFSQLGREGHLICLKGYTHEQKFTLGNIKHTNELQLTNELTFFFLRSGGLESEKVNSVLAHDFLFWKLKP